MRIYLSASLANAPLNARLVSLLGEGFSLVLPQQFTPDVPHSALPRAIYQRCIDEMLACDAALLMLDSFAIDCAFEVGFLRAHGKPVVGVAAATTRFLQHWMIKGGLSAVLCLDPVIFEAVREDPIVGERAREVQGWAGLSEELRRAL